MEKDHITMYQFSKMYFSLQNLYHEEKKFFYNK